jgi:dTDP-4-amino-4,6-dideoxygalactose transaminase
MTTLPFLPFSRPAIDEATIAAVGEVLRTGWITSGPKVQQFEQRLSAYFGGRPVRTFNSGTCTMEIALRIAGIGAGDEVITTPLSWVATANVILAVGATPVFADIDPATRNLDLAKVAACITPRTRAILPVHLSGLPVDMDALYALAKQHGLRVIEDAAQAFGSHWHGQRIGAFGDLVSFSFQANKNLTTAEGGCLVLNDEAEAKLAEKYRLQGVSRSGVDGIDVDVLGGKYNMTDFGDGFEAATGAQLPQRAFGRSNWHLFQIILPDQGEGTRARFMTRLQQDYNIGTGFHYAPIHLFTLYRERGFKEGMFPHAERSGRLTVTLPLFATMQVQDVERVVAAVKEVLA